MLSSSTNERKGWPRDSYTGPGGGLYTGPGGGLYTGPGGGAYTGPGGGLYTGPGGGAYTGPGGGLYTGPGGGLYTGPRRRTLHRPRRRTLHRPRSRTLHRPRRRTLHRPEPPTRTTATYRLEKYSCGTCWNTATTLSIVSYRGRGPLVESSIVGRLIMVILRWTWLAAGEAKLDLEVAQELLVGQYPVVIGGDLQGDRCRHLLVLRDGSRPAEVLMLVGNPESWELCGRPSDQNIGAGLVWPGQIQAWKKALAEGASGVFGNRKDQKSRNDAALSARLYQEIDQLKMERDFLAERSGP